MTEDILCSPETFSLLYYDCKDSRERSIAFIKMWEDKISPFDECISQPMYATLELLKWQHKITEEELK